MDKTTQALKKIPIFCGLSQNPLSRIGQLARVHRASKGQLIFQKQMLGNHLFVVLSGKIKIFSELSPIGKRKAFAYLSPGEFFGEMSLLDAKGRSLSAVALEDSELLTLSSHEFQHLLVNDSKFMLGVLRTIVERLRKANEEIESLTFGSLYARICRKLIELAAKTPQKDKNITVTHSELAEFAGTAREMVTKTLSSLRRLKVIAYKDHQIAVLEINKLKELAQMELEPRLAKPSECRD